MSFLSKRVNSVKPSPTLSLNAKAKELKAQGEDVMALATGEPDFDTPQHIKDAAIQAMNDGQTKYTPVPGTAELRREISKKFKRDNDLDYSHEEVIAGTGGKQILFNALMATIDAKDEVIIPAPYWVSYPDMVNLADGVPVIVPCPAENNFKIMPDDLDKAITSQTKWIILNSPSNPTGAAYTEDELESIAKIVRKHPGVWVMSDDMYEKIIYDDFKYYTLAQVAPDLKNRVLTINGVSKAYAMTGWRIGFAGGPQHLIKAMTKLQSQSTSNPSSISQAAAAEALRGDQEFLKEWIAAFKERRDKVTELLNAIDGISCLIPEGAFYVYPSCEGCIGKSTPDGKIIESDADFTDYLLDSVRVVCVPGVAFGLSPHFRISYAASIETLEESCHRIKAACDQLTFAS